MRVGDTDREKVAEQVRHALDEGRLSLDELDERLGQVYAAKTFGDLNRVVADLPGPAAPERSQVMSAKPSTTVPPSRIEQNPKLPLWLSISWRAWLVVVAINLVIWFLVSASNAELVYFWPMWVAGPWAAANIGLMVLFPPRRRPAS